MAAAVRLDRYENGVDLFERLGIIKLEHPAFLRRVVLKKDAEVQGLFFVRPASAPGLERAGVSDPRLLIQIIRIKDQ